MKLAKILSEKAVKGVISISADASIREAARKLCEMKIGALLIHAPGDSENYVGIISERDIIRSCCMEGACGETTLDKIMTKNMIVATSEDTVEYILKVMNRHKIRHIPVIENNKVSGVISAGDIMSCMQDQNEITIRRLSDFMGGTYGNKVF